VCGGREEEGRGHETPIERWFGRHCVVGCVVDGIEFGAVKVRFEVFGDSAQVTRAQIT
jgi:hypothetical protein